MEGDFVFGDLSEAVPRGLNVGALSMCLPSRHGPCCHYWRWFWWPLHRAIIKESSGSAHAPQPEELSLARLFVHVSNLIEFAE